MKKGSAKMNEGSQREGRDSGDISLAPSGRHRLWNATKKGEAGNANIFFLSHLWDVERREKIRSKSKEGRTENFFFAAVVAARKLLRLVPKMKKVYSISNRLRLCPTRLLLPLSLFLMSVCHTFLGFSPELSLRFFPKSSFSPSSFLSSDSAIPFSIFSGEHTRALTDCRMPNQLLLPLRYLTKLSLSLSPSFASGSVSDHGSN